VTAATPSPNIWRSPEVYERLNRAADPDGLVVSALDAVIDSVVDGEVDVALDIGCGTGFHLPMLAVRAERVVGVEPHAGLAAAASRRVARARLADRVAVRTALAEHLPLPDQSVDLVFSHWAYFFGPGCEPGLAEVDRVLRPGGVQVAVDLDVSATTGYARWFAAGGTGVRGERTASFFSGWSQQRLPAVWRFADRADLAAVLGIEFPPAVAAMALRETVGTTIAVPTVLRWRHRRGSTARRVRRVGPTS
jgi:SAM-dependent methyltransferase